VYRYTATETRFERDQVTVLSYGALVSYTFWLYAFGPSLTLLRDELHFSYTLLGVYGAVWSGGGALAGAGFAALSRRFSRAGLLWTSALGAVVGAALFVLGDGIAVTLAGAAVLGLAGTMLLTVTQALLSDRHGAQRDRAFTEANIGAGVCAVLAPLALGALALAPGGWRTAFALPALALGVLFVRHRRTPLGHPGQHRHAGPGRPLPLACWFLAALLALGVAVEFCIVYFGAEQLVSTGLSTGVAATAMSGFYAGILGGRLLALTLVGRGDRAVPLLHGSLVVVAAGFALFWLGASPAVAVAGLFVAGLGTASLYPLSLALVLGAAPGQEDQANSRSQVLVGLVVVAAPYLLGSLADGLGLTAAFAVEPVLIASSVALLLAGTRTTTRARQHPSTRP
jgi:MFS family permease